MRSMPLPSPAHRVLTLATLFSTWLAAGCPGGSGPGGAGPSNIAVPLVLVSRAINDQGSIYWDVPKDMPGVGPHSRVRPAAPGRLLVREPSGELRVLVDGSRPTAASLDLIDVDGPAVSYDGRTIVFAGLVRPRGGGAYDPDPARSTGAWRLYTIRADGSGLTQLTVTDETSLDDSRFGPARDSLQGYDDFDPVFLPDGRICFSSTRWPSYAQYSGVRASNLYVIDADGRRLHRITAERNGADRPLVDPVTGKIVYARWWRNHRFPVDSLATIPVDPNDLSKGYLQRDGLTADRDDPVGGPSLFRNAWQAATINPDGTGLALWSGSLRDETTNHTYGGAFTPDGVFYANFFPLINMTEASGFGGIRRVTRGPGRYADVIGISTPRLDYVHPSNPTSYGIENGQYAAEPEVLPDGRIVFSLAPDVGQDYGLYVMKADGTGLEKIHDPAGTSELRARALAPRPVPPILPDAYRDDAQARAASPLPPLAEGPYDVDGTFTFEALNVYFNAGVDQDIVSAPPVGSAASIRFFIDHQRQSPGSFPALDWPILLGERPIAADGSVSEPTAPAFVPLFEQLRGPQSAGYRVPLTGLPGGDGSAHVAGMNFAPSGAVARCVGCHAGHTLIPVPATAAEAQWTNLAPGATVRVSSARDPRYTNGLIDRRVQKGEIYRYWNSAPDQQSGQWVELHFPVPVSVRTVRLYNPRPGEEANSSIQIRATTVTLYADDAVTQEVASATSGEVAVSGTDVPFADVKARVVRVALDQVTGTFYGIRLASLAEIEVIARGEAP